MVVVSSSLGMEWPLCQSAGPWFESRSGSQNFSCTESRGYMRRCVALFFVSYPYRDWMVGVRWLLNSCLGTAACQQPSELTPFPIGLMPPSIKLPPHSRRPGAKLTDFQLDDDLRQRPRPEWGEHGEPVCIPNGSRA